MSLRKVAAALDTGPASLYAYVDDLDALRALVLDHALAGVDIRGRANAGWRENIVRVLESYARASSASPGLAQLAFGRVAVGPNALRIVETLLGLLAEGGIDTATAAWAVDLLVLYVTAIVAEHATGAAVMSNDGPVSQAVSAVSEARYPQIHGARAHMLSGAPEKRFRWALEVLIRGILEVPRPAKPARRSRKVHSQIPGHRRRTR
ncbi:MAG: TetR/AcrR family transcriptional regulator C-terminal domain-containing protein [Vicinamibacterales bacterium]